MGKVQPSQYTRQVNLRRLRIERQISQRVMAEKCGFPSASTVGMMEIGSQPISLKTVDPVAAAFDMSPSDVLAELDRPCDPSRMLPNSVGYTRLPAAFTVLAGETYQERLTRFGTTLEGRELEIFRDRIAADKPVTLKALGDRWHVSRERVRQLESRMLKRLHGEEDEHTETP